MAAQGNVRRLSCVLRRDQRAVEAVGFADFLAPAAGADEVRDHDAVDQHDGQRGGEPGQAVDGGPAERFGGVVDLQVADPTGPARARPRSRPGQTTPAKRRCASRPREPARQAPRSGGTEAGIRVSIRHRRQPLRQAAPETLELCYVQAHDCHHAGRSAGRRARDGRRRLERPERTRLLPSARGGPSRDRAARGSVAEEFGAGGDDRLGRGCPPHDERHSLHCGGQRRDSGRRAGDRRRARRAGGIRRADRGRAAGARAARRRDHHRPAAQGGAGPGGAQLPGPHRAAGRAVRRGRLRHDALPGALRTGARTARAWPSCTSRCTWRCGKRSRRSTKKACCARRGWSRGDDAVERLAAARRACAR